MRSYFRSFLLAGLCSLMAPQLSAGKLDKGFEALGEFDYFRARKLFYSVQRKNADPFASYGLATIFSRRDNPFHNYDSAAKYVNLSYSLYRKKPMAYEKAGWQIDDRKILALAAETGAAKLEQVRKQHSVELLDHFLKVYYLSSAKTRAAALRLRDELEFDRIALLNRSDSTALFILTHPQSQLLRDAQLLRERQVYEESTGDQSVSSYEAFLQKNPGSGLANTAYERLYFIHKQNKDIQGLARFVKMFPKAPQHIEAWKLLFSLSVKAYSYAELKKFLDLYPSFPLKNSILQELELNKLELYPYKKEDFVGFIDAQGKMHIEPVYDAASEFSEGLSLVVKGDSVFFVNKQNENPFGKYYEEASVFNNGIAPVKINGRWHFINRQGQTISGSYDEISELSDNVYVVRDGDRYGALDNYGQVLIEPRFQKLGDFRNGYAYFSEDGLYGFISKNGMVYNTRLEWISDFDKDGLAVIRKNDKYGLITSEGRIAMEPLFDLVMKTAFPVYIVVSGSKYGFFSSARCFITGVDYDYAREKPPVYYTDGNLFRLLKQKKQALADRNGLIRVQYGQFDEVGFPSSGFMLVKKRNKFGYADAQLNIRIPLRYTEADDFSDGVAIVAAKEKYHLLDTTGREIFTTPFEMEKLSGGFYQLDDEGQTIVSSRGETVLTNVAEVQKLKHGELLVTLKSGEIKLLSH